MARTAAKLLGGSRISDYITLGVVAKLFPKDRVDVILRETGRSSIRQRDLPAHVVVYYIIALALFSQASCREVLRCLLEGVGWLMGAGANLKVAGDSAISQARTRLGWKPMMRLHDEIVRPIATEKTRGAWFRQWRLVSIDGSVLDIPDEKEHEATFGRPSASRGESAFPQIRFVSLVENGTHVLFGTRMGPSSISEVALSKEVFPALKAGMLCIADRGFYGFNLWKEAHATGAELLWRLKSNLKLPREVDLPDGSFLSTVYPSDKDRRAKRNGERIRVVEYALEGEVASLKDKPDPDQIYRLGTTIFDQEAAPAMELAALYHDRWEIESAFDELKTHLKGRQTLLRSRKPDLILQEFYGLVMAHFAIRGLMHEAALKGDVDPDRLSFLHAVRVIRRKLPRWAALPPSGQIHLPPGRASGTP